MSLDFTREAPAIAVDFSLPGERVVRVLEALTATRGVPTAIVCDNGPEFAGQTLDQWAHARGVALQFIQPGKPILNAFAESFNGRRRVPERELCCRPATLVVTPWPIDSSVRGVFPDALIRHARRGD
jgi:transposase InsO family protein